MRKFSIEPPKAKTKEQALSSLMALCARAERSSGDARRLMSKWGVEPSEQECVLRRLIEERFIDDERFASMFTSEKRRLGGWGAYKIRMELGRKGISREIIDREMEGIDSEGEREQLEVLLRRRAERTKCDSKYKLRDRLMRYGASRGYRLSVVGDVVREIIGGMEEDDL